MIKGITIDQQQRLPVQEGATNVQMRCILQRFGVVSPVTFRWFHQPTSDMDRQINSTTHFAIAADGSTLTVDRVQRADGGVFTAVATDAASKSGNCTFYVQVSYAPVFETPAIREIQVNASQQVVLTCPYDSSPEANVSWLKDGAPLSFSRKFIFSGRNLTIKAVESLDKGSYQCRATNTVGSGVSSSISVVVLVPMMFVTTPPSVSIYVLGDNATLTCSARGSPRPTVQWKKGTATLTTDNLHTIITGTSAEDVFTSSYEFKSVGLGDRGTYSCVARNPDQTLQHLFEVAVLAPPEITSVFQSPTFIRIGTPMTLYCQASGIPKPSFTWFKDDRAIARVAETHFEEGWDGYLRVKEVIGSDTGLYQCRAVNEVGEAFSEAFRVVVTGLHFLVKPRPNKYILTNGTARMNCKVAGAKDNGEVAIDWLKDGKRVASRCSQADFNNSMCTGTFVMGRSLYITRMTTADEGLYSCIATEQGVTNPEMIRADSRIQILVPVQFEPTLPRTVRGDFHRALTILCQATGVPPPKIEWYRHGVHVLNNTYRTVIDGLMKFRALHVADADRYTCIASNKAGEKSKNVQISINTKLTTPAALSVTITPYNYFAQVQWSIIANGGYRVTNFQLEYRQIKPTVSEWSVFEDIEASERTMGLKNLDPETWYQVNVWANNKLGKGEVVSMEFETKEIESSSILELSLSQLLIIVVVIVAAVCMLIAIICVIVCKRHGSNLTFMRARQGAQDDNQALVNNQQDQSSHINPAYEGGGGTDSPQKDMELKEVQPDKGGGVGAGGDTKGQPDASVGQNGQAKKETTTT
ncbi:hemicentin-2-like isoform X2 [Acanthaster planci]|uniref:Hemicentin-2-like isoform X2 n=1 Tax=Acanthaster planci TaxID=133434 RepID=A0A8B7Z4Y9_ACAPL|nr:hemicentin-2-like isoform X2 [Acanthaster planci]